MPHLTDLELVQSLRSATCLACGGRKKQRQTLCIKCYRKLSASLRRRLYDGLGVGYSEAVHDSLVSLRVTKPMLPPVPEAKLF